MKNYRYIILSALALASLAASTTFAQILDPSITGGADESFSIDEASPVLNSAADEDSGDIVSGEINLDIPYNPDEEEDVPVPYTPDEAVNIPLNAATDVETGPALNMLIAFILSLGISTVIYRRAKPLMK